MDKLINATKLQIFKDFDIENKSEYDSLQEEELLLLLANQVAYYLEYRLEFLLSSLYRLDVKEQLVDWALSPENPEPANVSVARLILERQKKRCQTKLEYRQGEIEDLDEELKL